MVKVENLNIDLDQTFHCGQNFRWKRQRDGSYLGNPAGHSVRALRQGNDLILQGAKAEEEPFWRRYFDADSDYAALLAPVMDEHLQDAFVRCPGIRLLDQPFFETLICFILSANNNISRITGIVEHFCAIAPKDENGLHLFPTPQQVLSAGRDFVYSIGAGYRAPYLWEAAQRMDDGFDADALRNMDYEEACKTIRTFKGVGEKVADCVLLFSCGQKSAFPVDTWVEKLLTQWYGMSGTRSSLKKQARAHFGPYGGLAQQMLFASAMQQGLRRTEEKNT